VPIPFGLLNVPPIGQGSVETLLDHRVLSRLPHRATIGGGRVVKGDLMVGDRQMSKFPFAPDQNTAEVVLQPEAGHLAY
jgi:hypothetical protein